MSAFIPIIGIAPNCSESIGLEHLSKEIVPAGGRLLDAALAAAYENSRLALIVRWRRVP